MKIALVSTPAEALPPKGYAGIERVVYLLQQGLVERGHKVTVFATGDSQTQGNLEYYYQKALGSSQKLTYNPYYFLNHISEFFRRVPEKNFDIIHFNDAGRFSLYFARYLSTPFISTLHGSYHDKAQDELHIQEEKRKQVLLFKNYPFVSISDAQRDPLPGVNFVSTVYNSVPLEKFNFNPRGGTSLSWLGRITEDKGVDTALKLAHDTGHPFSFYGFIDEGSKKYFSEVITPLLDQKSGMRYLGECTDDALKTEYYGNSRAFLFPIRWSEPFGMVMLEAMASGTPVVAYARGAVPEVIVDGVTGFIVNPSADETYGDFAIKNVGEAGLREAIERIYSLSEENYILMRKKCREHVEQTFSNDSMVEGYLKVYEQILKD